MFNLGVILARGNSKRLPRKNILPLNGIPLIAHVIKAGLSSNGLNDLIVSTDCEEIADVSKKYGAKVPFMRPAELAQDSSTSDEALIHAVLEYEKIFNVKVDNVILLQPTSPFTTGKMIDECIALFEEQKYSSVLTVVPVSKRCEWTGQVKDGFFVKILDEETCRELRSVDQYVPSGNVYVGNRLNFEKFGRLISSDASGVVKIGRREAIDIDYDLDFKFAKCLI